MVGQFELHEKINGLCFEPIQKLDAKTLDQAKRESTRRRMHLPSTLEIHDSQGMVAYRIGRHWVNECEFD